VLHVYGILLMVHVARAGAFWTNTVLQVMLIAGIAMLLNGVEQRHRFIARCSRWWMGRSRGTRYHTTVPRTGIGIGAQ